MEQPKPGYVAPVYPMQPMAMPQSMPIMQQSMPMPQPMPTQPMMQKPVHNDIHLHASYQQTSILFPQPKPKVHTAAVVCPPQQTAGTGAGSVLVLFILLVIITRTLHHHKC